MSYKKYTHPLKIARLKQSYHCFIKSNSFSQQTFKLKSLAETSGPNFIELLNNLILLLENCSAEISRTPATHGQCGLVFWLVTLFWKAELLLCLAHFYAEAALCSWALDIWGTTSLESRFLFLLFFLSFLIRCCLL